MTIPRLFNPDDRIKVTREGSTFLGWKGKVIATRGRNFAFPIVVKLDNWKHDISFGENELEKIDD
ncbi:hypothetical protein EVB81_207 [Rhizobium phage RHph_I46]|uniref:Uncharacterized protein n=1 Tax=Rhizobium phage RHph_I1_9 TaxID=2509729 RepID=A0A7S5R9S6_9CAUD|nr:hypothetical protein PP936_gp205 [Rhizobium phage RHph_I1_9]QIG69776.1 hypothetical protein EVB81_207 [Rhizobium phage RHph_I46]QIG71057.1 hypothetical protein EVB92_207 [Rhizobium phage RHph_I9]QIG73642.1 hypothetical protein EVC04_205 [Rhizobium phage RHph_I1_9]QIG76396.1 hypothetical protein EVC25_207 [Rhizobium phage RHph_I34]